MTPSKKPKRVVFPEWDEPRIAAARESLLARSICQPIAVADIDADQLAVLMNARDMSEKIARRFLTRPLFRAAAMVACGKADAMVAGADTPTKKVIEAAAIAIGMREGIEIPSSFFLMRFPDGRELIFADCAVNIAPDEATLCAIALASQKTAQSLLGHAEIALLSYSTGRSGTGASVDLVRDAAEKTGFLGPIQADAALNSHIAKLKGLGTGNANVLVFPDLNAANIAYKLCQELAGAKAIGPILQGFRYPVADLSRGAGIEDIVSVTELTLQLGD